MRGRRGVPLDYGMLDVERELACGVHPEVVAARLGTSVEDLVQVAAEMGWPVSYKQAPLPSADETLTRYAKLHGLDLRKTGESGAGA